MKLWNETYEGYQNAVDKALRDTANFIKHTSRDETRYLVHATGLKCPGTYYFGDRLEGTLERYIDTYPGLDERNLAGKKAVSYRSRDGLEITGYLTLPRGSHKRPLPAIIHPHGGPASRDFLGFDIWTELLASQGYVVLQMDFRGSSGYGTEFQTAGLKRWGLEMQDDITDGAMWLIEQGIADPDRIGIVGASYGGYAALMGAVKSPDFYQCAVSFAGVSDLITFVSSRARYVQGDIVKEQIGGTWRDRAQLTETSPLRQVDKIKVPILLAHGDRDRVVDVKQSSAMAEALKKKGKTHQFLLLEDGDHSLSFQHNRTLFFNTLISFLDKHLKD